LWALILVGAEEIVAHFPQIEGAVVQLAQETGALSSR